MALKTKVKVSNITSLSEARYCAGMGVDFLGFPFFDDFESDFKRFTEICSWVSGPQLVIECLEQHIIKRVVNEKILADYIQLDLLFLMQEEVNGYKLFILLPNKPSLQMLQKLDSLRNKGNCVLITLDGLKNYRNHLDGFLVFIEETDGANEQHISMDEIFTLPVNGIFIAGNDEIKPGIQNYEHLSSILEKLTINED
jgi:phosphoribosylanthranilate isomerase